MAELKCPHCGQAFTVDDAELNSIISQIRDSEFNKDLNNRIDELTEHMQEKHELEMEAKENEIRLSCSLRSCHCRYVSGMLMAKQSSRIDSRSSSSVHSSALFTDSKNVVGGSWFGSPTIIASSPLASAPTAIAVRS